MPDSPDDNLEHVHRQWLERLHAGEITREEVRSHLELLNLRLEFLQKVQAAVAESIEFAENAAEFDEEIETQVGEIKMLEKYLSERNS